MWQPVLAVASQSHWEVVHEKRSTRALRCRRLALGNSANRVCNLVCRMHLTWGELPELCPGMSDPVLAVAIPSHGEEHGKRSMCTSGYGRPRADALEVGDRCRNSISQSPDGPVGAADSTTGLHCGGWASPTCGRLEAGRRRRGLIPAFRAALNTSGAASSQPAKQGTGSSSRVSEPRIPQGFYFIFRGIRRLAPLPVTSVPWRVVLRPQLQSNRT